MISTNCNGCRILRKGCSENCLLRQSLTFIESPTSQSNANVFVSKLFGRSSLFYLLKSAPRALRPAVFQSLLYEACDRTINLVSGVIGLMYTGNWSLCESAVDIVLKGGILKPTPELLTGFSSEKTESVDVSELADCLSGKKRSFDDVEGCSYLDIDLRLTPTPLEMVVPPREGRVRCKKSRSFESEIVSGTTSCESENGEVEDFDITR